MVDAIQLHPRIFSRCRYRNLHGRDILHIYITKNGWYRAQLVGKYVSFLSACEIELDYLISSTSNSVWQNTADAKGASFMPLPESGFIGPAKWS